MAENKLVTIHVDGRAVEVPAGTSVVDAAHQAGVEIPIFCHHPRLEPVGMCRMCLVDVGTPAIDRATGQPELDEAGEPVIRFFPKLQAGCTMRASEGMVVRTETEAVAEARRSVLEFLLTSHPLDCPVCDKGGECPLQNLTMRYGPGQSRFTWGEKYHFPKPVPIGPLIALDRERCVLCARCIRFEDEIAGDNVLGFENRGRGMEVVSFSDPAFDSYFSGNTSDICPVGALTTKDFRFEARAWELVGQPSVCNHCPVGCNTMVDGRFGQIERVMPRENAAVNEIWLCDKGRFAHHFASDSARLEQPLVRRDGELVEASWDEALGHVAERLAALVAEQGAGAVGGIAGGSLANEDLYLFGRFLRSVIGSNHVDHRPALLRDDLIARAGLVGEARLTELGAGDTVVVAGLDVEEEAPVLFLNLRKALRRGARVLILAGRPQKLDAEASLSLRYQPVAKDSLLAGLLHAVLAAGEASSADTPARTELAQALAGYDAERLGQQHPVRAEDLSAAAAAIVGAERLVVCFGRELAEAGLAPALEALVAAAGKAGQEGSGLLAVGPQANSQGAADMGVLPGWLPGYGRVDDPAARAALAEHWPAEPPAEPGMHAESMLAGGVKALYVMGSDPAGDDPRFAEALGRLDFLVVQELFLTPTAALADVVLPARSSLERAGSFTSLSRRVQRFHPTCDPVGASRPDWEILRDLGLRMGATEPYASVSDVFDEIARVAPGHAGLDYASLGAAPAAAPTDILLPFAPQTEARSVSYEGTAYRAGAGAGRCWAVREASADSALAWRPAGSEAAPSLAEGQLLLVTTRRLYDAGRMLSASLVMQPLIPLPLVEIGVFDAAARGLGQGDRVRVTGPAGSVVARLEIVDGLTPGLLQAPEGLAWSLPVRALTRGRPMAGVTLERLDEAGEARK
ncbi:MAG: NADH-quinone oxidoreductase subunit NuoG [Caldilineae bacterium]|nr:NADH-quinone oxidoreductase subunit NuoG [Caldilineae bacterium]